MIERCQTVKNKKRKWLQFFIVSGYVIYLIGMTESYAQEDSKVTIDFYEEKKKEPHKTNRLPQTGEDSYNNVLQISGISILFFITVMISYRTLMNEERF